MSAAEYIIPFIPNCRLTRGNCTYTMIKYGSHGATGFAMLFKFVLEASPGELPVVCLETFPNQLAMGTEDGIVDAVR